MPGPLDPIVSSKPYGPPETEKKMMPMIAARLSFRVRSRTSIDGRSLGSSAITATLGPLLSRPNGTSYHGCVPARQPRTVCEGGLKEGRRPGGRPPRRRPYMHDCPG